MRLIAAGTVLLSLAVCAQARAEPLQVFYRADDGGAAAAETVTVEDQAVEIAPVARGDDPRAACASLCVWFERDVAAPDVRMVMFSRRDGVTRDRTVTFVGGEPGAGVIRANLRKILLISRSVFGEQQFDPGAISVELPPGGVETAAPVEKGPPRWTVAVGAGASFIGTNLSLNTAGLEAAFRFYDRALASLSMTYLIPSSFTLMSTTFRVGGIAARLGVGLAALDREYLKIRVMAGPQVTWYEIFRGEEQGQWAMHLYGFVGAAADLRLYGPLFLNVRGDVCLSGADVIISVQGLQGEKRLTNPYIDLLAGVSVAF